MKITTLEKTANMSATAEVTYSCHFAIISLETVHKAVTLAGKDLTVVKVSFRTDRIACNL